jgi:hypothetical protein
LLSIPCGRGWSRRLSGLHIDILVMMMHPDDFEKLVFIAKVFLVIGILIYSFKSGNAVYHILRYEM